jgi:hypothetical protein
MADAATAHPGMQKSGTSHGRLTVVEIVDGAGIAGKGIIGKRIGPTIDIVRMAKGAPKSASNPATGCSSSTRVARSCNLFQNRGFQVTKRRQD